MAYIKPLSPIKLGEDFIYPLTSYDQIIMEDGSRWNGNTDLLNQINGKVSGVAVTAVIPASGWQTDGEYIWCNNVYAPGVTENNVVIVSPSNTAHVQYGDCGIRAVSQWADHINFNAEAIPEWDLAVNVLVLNMGVNA